LLWDPVAAGGELSGKRVVFIAPDGPMHLMPFAALPAGPGYLIEQVNLACVSTGKDFLRSRRPGSHAGALLVGGVDFNSRPSLAQAPATRARGRLSRLNDLEWNPLPGTTEEVDAIAAAMAGASLPTALLKGGLAQKATVSACETGLGEIKRGEGVFGLQRSFVMAGAEALVMSLWSVPDQETRDLMVSFYRHILAGGSKREGFRQSQLGMLKARAHPFFWAAFQYLGVD
jgi:CHAT domain-containing protein